jgi:hypothetical protein
MENKLNAQGPMKNSTLLLSLPIYLLVGVFLLGQRVLTVPASLAFTMSGGNYILEMGNLNSFSGEATGSDKGISFNSGQSPQGLSLGGNKKVKLGFQYIHPLRGFSFSLSQSLIDFGVLSPTNPVTRNTILRVNNSSAEGFSVTASEDHPLQSAASGQSIPDTTCDNGTCTDLISGPWQNTLTYGFGYRCDPITDRDCADGFSNSESYKQFSDTSKGETGQAVMVSATNGSNKQVKITYKVNISGTQPPGSYTNTITFIAVPTF